MKNLVHTLILLLTVSSLHSQNIDPTFQWAVHGGSPSTDFILDMTMDEDRNVFITGYFQETMVLGNFAIQSNGLDDFFVAKLDSTGEVAWLKGFGGAGLDAGFAIETDFVGNIVVLGYMQDEVDFGGATLTSAGTYDICLFKLDPSGQIIWARRDGGAGQDQAFGLAIDNQANIYVSGFFAGSAFIGNNLLDSDGFLDAVLYKVSPSGGVDWVQNGGGSGNDIGQAVDVDEAGDVYVTGSFENSASFGNNILTSSGSSDVFLAKYSTNSTLLWAKKAGGPGTERPFDLIYHDGDIVLTGFFVESASFDFSSLSSSGEQDIFLAKYSDTGIHQWAKSFGGVNDEWGRKLDHNENGDIYLTGFYEGFAAFDTDGIGAQLGQDAFIAKTDDAGSIYWVRSDGGFGEEEGFGMAVDTISDQIYMAMNFNQNAIISDTSIITFGDNDFIVAAFLDTFSNQIVIPQDSMVSIFEYDNDHISVYPNPASDYINVSLSDQTNIQKLILADVNGKVLYTEDLTGFIDTEYRLDLEQFASGHYIVALVNEHMHIRAYKRFVKE